MALQSSGLITLAQIQAEFGGANPISLSEYWGLATGLPTSGQTISTSNFYGKSFLVTEVITTSRTWTPKLNNARYIHIFVIGAGGSGGSAECDNASGLFNPAGTAAAAGGGGGGAYSGASPAAGGPGGGGTGGGNANATAGTYSLGAGGGGGPDINNTAGANGGSGIVVVRYQISPTQL